jgi:hypothetical protein
MEKWWSDFRISVGIQQDKKKRVCFMYVGVIVGGGG